MICPVFCYKMCPNRWSQRREVLSLAPSIRLFSTSCGPRVPASKMTSKSDAREPKTTQMSPNHIPKPPKVSPAVATQRMRAIRGSVCIPVPRIGGTGRKASTIYNQPPMAQLQTHKARFLTHCARSDDHVSSGCCLGVSKYH